VGQTKYGLYDTSSWSGSSDLPQPIKTSHLHKMWSKCFWQHGACPGDACSCTVLQQMSYLTDVCDVTSLSKTVLTKNCPKQSGKGFLGVALVCFLTHPLCLSDMIHEAVCPSRVFLNLTHWLHDLPPRQCLDCSRSADCPLPKRLIGGKCILQTTA
jgi:hypothetical protein